MVIVNTLICEGKSSSWIKKSRKQINTVCSVLRLHPLLSHPLLYQHRCRSRHTVPRAAANSPIKVRNPNTHKYTPNIIGCCLVARDDISMLIILELRRIWIVQSTADIWGQQNGTLMPAQLSLNFTKREY
jgi:hypothetical protein